MLMAAPVSPELGPRVWVWSMAYFSGTDSGNNNRAHQLLKTLARLPGCRAKSYLSPHNSAPQASKKPETEEKAVTSVCWRPGYFLHSFLWPIG